MDRIPRDVSHPPSSPTPQETDALTLMVAGSFKELLTVAAGIAVFKDSFTRTNAAGLGVLVIGVALFNVRKYLAVRPQASAFLTKALRRGYTLAAGEAAREFRCYDAEGLRCCLER